MQSAITNNWYSQHFNIKIGNQTARAVLVLPSTTSVCLVVLIPGSGQFDVDSKSPSAELFAQIAGGLAARGFAVTYASKGSDCDDWPLSCLEAEYLIPLATLITSVREAMGVVLPIVLVGHSLGGRVAGWLSYNLDVTTGVAMINAPFSSMNQSLMAQFSQFGNASQVLFEQYLLAQSARSRDYFQAANAFDPLFWMTYQHGRILCIHCENDCQVPPNDAAKWKSAFSGAASATCYKLAGLDHYCRPVNDEYCLNDSRIVTLLGDWLSNLFE